MKTKMGSFQLNVHAIIIAILYAAFLIFQQGPVLGLPSYLFNLRLIPAGLGLLYAGILGWKASRIFGGRKNIIGRILLSFSLAILTYLVGVPILALEAMQRLNGLNLLLANSGIDGWLPVVAQCFAAFALAVGARAMFDRYDRKFLLVVIISLALAAFVGWSNFAYADPAFGQTTALDTVLWVGVIPTLAFLMSASALLLVRYLGKWYIARTLAIVVFAFLLYSTLLPILDSYVLYVLFRTVSLDAALSVLRGVSTFVLFLIAIGITQVRLRVTGKYY